MTGPEHYQLAEAAQEAAAAIQASRQPGPEATPLEALLDALVHATLALAAATALGSDKPPFEDQHAWVEVASAWKKPGQ